MPWNKRRESITQPAGERAFPTPPVHGMDYTAHNHDGENPAWGTTLPAGWTVGTITVQQPPGGGDTVTVPAAWTTKDSGAREVMETGSQRDTREGKGRFELISPFALARLAGVYERGAKKYDARNWEKGQPFSRFLDSALRHLNRFAMGWTDEDHLSQALWNVAAIIHFQEIGRTDLDDLPHYQSGPNQQEGAK